MIVKGQKVNERYQILRTIGEGGMANVYLAHDTILDRDVAVKVLRGDLADDEKFVRRFQREAISASSLSHPNIVEMYDVGEDDGKYYIVMEYVDGKTLKGLIKRRGALSLPETIDIMLQLTSGIACAHDSYIIHRDIKPQNVLILDDGTVKITDFGIAMALNSNELTQTNSVMGSVHYLPPEQANGNGSTIKSDIYSLGILMYELLTGKVPFKGDNAVEIAIKQMKEPIPSVCKNNPLIPQSIENIILKATAKNPKNRYDNVNEMYADLKNCLNEENKNVKRLVYEYPEQELEDTKVMPDLSKIKTQQPKKKTDKVEKGLNKALIVIGSICGLLAVGLIVLLFLWPKLTTVPDVKIPNVKGLTVAEAEQLLLEVGLTVSDTTKEESDDIVESGRVIKIHNYNTNDVVKKGKQVTLVVSTGSKQILIENYINKNYYEVKADLEAKGLQVIIEKQEVEDKDEYQENTIISQSVSEGTKLTEGDIIKLVIPYLITEYPDFINESWSVDDVRAFCDEYGLILDVELEETNEHTPGSIIFQSRAPKSKVVSGVTLKIVVAKETTIEVPEPEVPEVETPEDNLEEAA